MRLSARLMASCVACLSLILLVNVPANAQTAPITAFTLDSEVGDPVAGGFSVIYGTNDAQFSAQDTSSSVTMTAETPGGWPVTATIQAPQGQTLEAGDYETKKVADSTHAGLNVSRDARECGSSTGSLTIHRIVALPVLPEFAASYTQHCDGASGSLFGELRYNTSVGYKAAKAIPEGEHYLQFFAGDTRDVSILSYGSEPLDVQAATIIGSEDFRVTDDPCSGQRVAPNQSCGIEVSFTGNAPGPNEAILRVVDGTRRKIRDVRLLGYDPAPKPNQPPPPSTTDLRPTVTRTRLYGEYGRRGKYELFHLREPVVQAGFLIPRAAGRQLDFEVQIKRGGGWQTLATESFPIRRGVAAASYGARRGTYRGNNSFDGNAKYAPSTSSWQYFRVTR